MNREFPKDLLFLIYKNDLEKYIKSNINVFADDMLYCNVSDDTILCCNISDDTILCCNISDDTILCCNISDDTMLYFNVSDERLSTSELSLGLKLIKDWAYQWKMGFNPDPNKQAVEIIFSQKKIKPILIFNGVRGIAHYCISNNWLLARLKSY